MLAALRIARRLQACLLLLFLCSVGAAAASPLIGVGASLSLVCVSQGGLKLSDGGSGSTGNAPLSEHKLDCALCLPAGAPAPAECAVADLVAPADALGIDRMDTPHSTHRVLRPPARAPPRFLRITEKKVLT